MMGRESVSVMLLAIAVVVTHLSLKVGGERVTVNADKESGLASLLS